MFRVALSLLLLGTLVPLADAQSITGQVRSSTGAAVPGVNIDCFDSSGNELDLANDGTDANGNFTTTVVDGAGVYTFIFYPPAPPATTHLVAERANVVVVTNTNLGIITLGAGVLLSGRTVRTGTIPVSNVTLTVIDGPTGNPVTQVQTKTNAFGQFNLAVPPHSIQLQLDATSSAFVLGSRALDRNPSGNLALGDVLLPPGAMVTAHVQRANGVAIGGADFDFAHVGNGHTAFVPNDNTNSLGNLSVVVPVGTYDIEVCPPAAAALPAKALLNVSISTTTNLGTIVVPNGVRLFGTVLDAHGAPASHVDVDVFSAATGVEVPLCNDDTNSSGAYSVYVPTGTYDVLFLRNGAGAAIGGDLHQNVVVNAQTQQNGQLPRNGNGNSFGGSLGDGGSIVTFDAAKARGTGGQAPANAAPRLVVASDGALELAAEGPIPAAWLLIGQGPRLAPGSGATLVSVGEDRRALAFLARGGVRCFVRAVALDARGAPSFGPLQLVNP